MIEEKTGNGLRKALFVSVMALFMLMSSFCAFSQNNRYRIDDDLYKYLADCERNIRDANMIQRADTFFFMAKERGDLKAQCLAKNLKAEHYFSVENLDMLLIEMKRIQSFVLTTKYKTYYFAPWNRYIRLLALKGRIQASYDEIAKYKKTAQEMKNAYAIGMAYKLNSELYMQQSIYDKAIEENLKLIAFYKAENLGYELGAVYNTVAVCYYQLRDWKQAEEYFDKALATYSKDQYVRIIRIYAYLLDIYDDTGRQQKAKEIVKKMEYMDSKYRSNWMMSNDNYLEHMCNYYIRHKQLAEAAKTKMQIEDEATRLRLSAEINASSGNYEIACMELKRSTDITDSIRVRDLERAEKEISSMYDNTRLIYQRNELLLKQKHLELERMKMQKRLAEEKKRKVAVELKNREARILLRDEELVKMKAELHRQQSDNKRRAEIQKYEESVWQSKQRLILVLSISLSIVLLGFLFFVVRRRLAMRMLQKEKSEADRARKAADSANQLKSMFLQNVSHEIRTPLNAIVGFNELLNDPDEDLEAEEKQNFVKLIRSNTDLLLTIINDILDLSKLETGTYTLKLSDVDVAALCQDTVKSVEARAKDGVALKLNIPPAYSDLHMNSDPQRVQQVLINLLTNACKNTTEGSITLEYDVETDDAEKRMLRFTVTDTGCGVPPEKMDSIFQRFEKLDDFKQGTGLGLNICQRISDLLGGYVSIDKTYHAGARFYFVIELR